MVIFLFSIILAISSINSLVLRWRKEYKLKQYYKKEEKIIDVIEGKRVILENKNKGEREGDGKNKIGFIGKNFI